MEYFKKLKEKGKKKKYLTWKKFLKMHIDTLFTMDFFTTGAILLLYLDEVLKKKIGNS